MDQDAKHAPKVGDSSAGPVTPTTQTWGTGSGQIGGSNKSYGNGHGTYDPFKKTHSPDLQELQDMLKKIQSDVNKSYAAPKAADLKDLTKDKMHKAEQEVLKHKEILQQLDKVEFTAGEAVFLPKSKEYGILREIFISSGSSTGSKVMYNVQTLYGERYLDLNEVLPINDATKILYKGK